MDFAVSERLQTILDMIQEFIEKELIPREAHFAAKEFSEIEPEIEDCAQARFWRNLPIPRIRWD